jgi:FMN phosphatase YigB (HAD superfamily)
VIALDYDAYDVLTFDTYGTLIDWETGCSSRCAARSAMRPRRSATMTC